MRVIVEREGGNVKEKRLALGREMPLLADVTRIDLHAPLPALGFGLGGSFGERGSFPRTDKLLGCPRLLLGDHLLGVGTHETDPQCPSLNPPPHSVFLGTFAGMPTRQGLHHEPTIRGRRAAHYFLPDRMPTYLHD